MNWRAQLYRPETTKYQTCLPAAGTCRAPAGARSCGPLHDVAVHTARVLDAAGAEADLIPSQRGGGNRRGVAVAAIRHRAGNTLKLLPQIERPLRKLPRALHLGRHDPEKRR